MMGRFVPTVDPRIFNWRSTGRSGVERITGLMEITRVGSGTGILAASPIEAWSFGTRSIFLLIMVGVFEAVMDRISGKGTIDVLRYVKGRG